ncbi:MAG: fibronectin type III domain-containing protein [Ignavibacteriales bacterium]|nr:fibronectin type III domain-containing protein [Ignavibacteriales bacterium]
MKKLLLFASLFFFSFVQLLTQNLEIHVINVGWGGSVLVKGPNGTTVLLDAGNTGKGTNEVVPYLQSIGITTAMDLNYTIISHQHCDHNGGIDEVVNAGYNILNKNYYNGSTYSSTCVDGWNTTAATTTAGALVAMPVGTVIQLGNGATLTCIARNGSIIGGGSVSVSDENDRSIAVLVEYGGFDFIWAGDMGGGSDACTGRSTSQTNVETAVVQAISPGGAFPLISSGGIDVLYANHHGSESSTNPDWMNLSRPAVAVINTGAGQTTGWDLPRIDVVEHVLKAQSTSCITVPASDVYQTEEGAPSGSLTSFAGYCVGDIKITTDGVSTFTVSGNGAVTQGPNEVTAAGLPKTYNLDDSGAPPDVTPPVISNVQSSGISSSGATITWTTDESSNSVVEYGLTTSYGSSTTNASMVTSHSVALSGLTASTLYHYRVKSTDASNNTATSGDFTFTTSAASLAPIETFADGNFTASPAWGGNTTAYQVVTSSDVAAGATSSNTLRLNYTTASAGTRYLRTQRTATWGTSQSWSFWIGRRAQAATVANHSIVWLFGNNSNLTASGVDGYRVRFGDDTGDDNIVLQVVTNNAATDIITSSGTVPNGLTDIGFMVRVTRTSGNVWTLYTSTLPTTSGSGAIATTQPTAANTSINQGSVTNSAYTTFTNGYFGFMAVHSSGADARIGAEFDQLYFDISSSSPMSKPRVEQYSPETNSLVNSYQLYQNVPNPFNPTTTIRFELPTDATVKLSIYNILGVEIATIIENTEMGSGVHSAEVSAQKLSSGVYFYRLTATTGDNGTIVQTRKMVVMK